MNFTDFDEPEELSAFAYFITEGVISAGGPVLKQGKEACVYRCPADEMARSPEVAVKVYKNIEHRSFKAMSGYLQGRFIEAGINRRDTMHILSTPSLLQAFWVDSEFSVIQRLYDEGLPVPFPVAKGTTALAMEFIYADDETFEAAPRLRDYRCEREERREIKSILLNAIDNMLNLDIIHGDLSPYNVLVSKGKPVIIDFPQAVDVRYNTRGQAMLERDILNICRYCPDPEIPPEHEAAQLTSRFWDPIRMGPG
ncbi:RIO1 family regulatory kinase/ATPase domain-containing protein [Spirochaeta dissipatitropha]